MLSDAQTGKIMLAMDGGRCGGAQTKIGTAVVPFALDHGVWTANADKLRQRMKATYAAPGFNRNLESPIWYAPRSERTGEMRRAILAIVVTLALWPIHASAVDLTVFGLKTTSDLLAVCTTPENDAVHKEAIHYCFGYLEGAVGYHNALSTHKDMKRLTCYPAETTREDGVRAFIRWAQAHQNDTKLMSEAPVIGLMRSLSAQWPCK